MKARTYNILIGLAAVTIVGLLAWPHIRPRSASAGEPAAPATLATAAAAVPKPVRPNVTTATFEPVYRAAKSVQGATQSGVTYIKYGELLQGLATEISIAKDHPLNTTDRELVALYEEAFACYQASAELWKDNLDNKREDGSLVVAIEREGQMVDLSRGRFVVAYNLPVTDRAAPSHTPGQTTFRYKTIPKDSVQRVWLKADETLQKATNLYYGRS